MICLRCGYCCINLDVAIVNPVSIQPDGTVNPEDSGQVIFKSKGQQCPHLVYLEDKAVCKIHELPCYRGTPCQQFEQMGSIDDVCVMSYFFQSVRENLADETQFKDFKKDPKAS
jgi:hypothetical protein